MSAPDLPDALDFWVGTWDATWEGGHGTNTVTREDGGHAIVERFESKDPDPFTGTSLSTYDADERCWRQLWVDSNGHHWWFAGGPADEGFQLTAIERPAGAAVLKRMTFSDIRPDTFHWRWERSDDGGTTWSRLWAIRYRRIPSG